MSTQDELESPYGYVPTNWVCTTFLVLFSITTLLHLGETIYFNPRRYWIIPTMVMCGLGEIIGWTGRLWSSKNVFNGTPFLMQISTTIIAPTFLTAALYTILGIIINILGPQYSRLTAKKYLAIFVTADVVALVVQALGGGIASTSSADHPQQGQLGSKIMVGGIIFQMAGVTVYAILATEFLLRFHFQNPFPAATPATPATPASPSHSSQSDTETGEGEKPWLSGALNGHSNMVDGRGVMPPRIGLMVIGLVLATILVYIRSIYRTVELLGGWRGHIIRTEIYFNLLDATPIVLAMFVLNFLPPGCLLRVEDTVRY